MKTKLPAQLSALALTIASANAAFIGVDNFESYTDGSAVNGQGGWSADGDTFFVADPADPGNKVLSSAETPAVTTTNVYHSIPTIAGGTTGTIFFRARAGNPADFVIGSSDRADPAAGSWDSFEGYMRFSNGNIDVRDNTPFATIGTYNADEWYNIWLVLDHTADTTTVYVNQGSADAGAPAGAGVFRVTGGNPDHDDLINIFIRNNNATNPGLIDDIYVDNTGANLTNPVSAIPEPATGLLGLLGLAFGLRRRR